MHTNPEVLALLALGEDIATSADRDHITTCPDCSQEVAELTRIADVSRSSTAHDTLTVPAPEVWERITAELGLTGSRQPSAAAAPGDQPASAGASATVSDLAARRGSTPATTTRPTSAGRRFLALAVAAALALVVGVGVGISYEQRVVQPVNRVIASARLNPLPQWAGTTGTAEVTADGRGNRELVLHVATPKPVSGTLHVWLMKDSIRDPQTMGVVRDGVARIPIPRRMSLFTFPVVDVSAEPPNDRDPGHSGDSVVRGALT